MRAENASPVLSLTRAADADCAQSALVSLQPILPLRSVTSASARIGNLVRRAMTFRVYDCSASVARAVEWLGDRYLWAKPIKMARLPRDRASHTPGCSIDRAPAHHNGKST